MNWISRNPKQSDKTMKEFSLVVFTILSQMAVGAFFVLQALRFWMASQAGLDRAEALTDAVAPACCLVMILALAASLFHLGAPARAWRAFSNLRSSWLSREILLGALFTGLVGLLTGAQLFDLGTPALRNGAGYVAALVGFFFVYSMTSVYRLRTIPTWNRWTTPASFFASAFLLGGLGVGVFWATDSGATVLPPQSALQPIALAAIALLLVELAIAFVDNSRSAARHLSLVVKAAKRSDGFGSAYKLRVALIVLSILAAGTLAAAQAKDVYVETAAILAFALALASEALGRFLFYRSRSGAALAAACKQ
jgi:anaerobic dimethyl sulfoxide reductase subunit C (anchor subunit)